MTEIVIFKNKTQVFAFPIPTGTSNEDIDDLGILVKNVDKMLAVLGSPFEITVIEEVPIGRTTFKMPEEARRD